MEFLENNFYSNPTGKKYNSTRQKKIKCNFSINYFLHLYLQHRMCQFRNSALHVALKIEFGLRTQKSVPTEWMGTQLLVAKILENTTPIM